MARDRMRTSYRQEMRLFGSRGKIIWFVVLVAALAYLPSVLTNRAAFGYYFTETQLLGIGLFQVNLMVLAMMAALALNVLVGYTGLLSLGHAAFFSVGAIVAAVLDVQSSTPFPLVVVAAAVAGVVVGGFFGLPSLRLRGLYLLLSTLALHFIALYVFLRYQTDNFGPAGISYGDPTLFGLTLDTDTKWFFFLVVVAGLLLLISRNLLVTREGRSLVALRDHDVAAGSLGVNVGAQRIKTFALTSGMTSAVGALYVYYLGNTSSDAYTLEFVISYFAIIIIGGMGSMLGAVLGAIVWQLLPQAIQTLSSSVDPGTPLVGDLLNQYQGQTVSLILGLTVILLMIFRPLGLNGLWLDVRRGVKRWPYST